MDRVVTKAYAKINLGLDVIKKRPDGYHEVKMIMQTVDLYDVLLVSKKEEDTITISTQREDLPVNEDNLIYKAVKLMKDVYSFPGGVHVELVKNIPIAAGMAGGSTDAAAAMRAVNDLFELNRPVKELEGHAVKIGADVPYCIQGGTVLSEGIGEFLTDLPNAPQCILLIAKPDIMVSTKYVYENLNLPNIQKHPDIDAIVHAIKEGDVQGMIEPMDNVLASVTEEKYGIIKEIKQTMEKNGAIKALMSGSGPTVFGIFETMVQAATAFDAIKEKGMAREIFISKFVNPQEEK
ncbi:MAG: 4-(cytidine 5'-diphospho)-2-C-methyl-D-erythritol kinase [Lachnospiraceae bacterium]|nr:4-(cytidine 5'-diphospho)-2-C-methyl-D-erythritol kinase [Lachnospiraceae bacterium]